MRLGTEIDDIDILLVQQGARMLISQLMLCRAKYLPEKS